MHDSGWTVRDSGLDPLLPPATFRRTVTNFHVMARMRVANNGNQILLCTKMADGVMAVGFELFEVARRRTVVK